MAFAQYEFADPSSFRSPRQRAADMCHRDSSSQALNTSPQNRTSRTGRAEHRGYDDIELYHSLGLRFDDAWRRDVDRVINTVRREFMDEWSAYRAQRQAYRESVNIPAHSPYTVDNAHGLRSHCQGQASRLAQVHQRAKEARERFLAAQTHATRDQHAVEDVQRRAEDAQTRFWVAYDGPDTAPALSSGGDTEDEVSPATDDFAPGSVPFAAGSDVVGGCTEESVQCERAARIGTPTVIPSSWPRAFTWLWMPQPVRPRDIPRAALLEELAEDFTL